MAKAQLISLLFNLEPAIKGKLDDNAVQRTMRSFYAHFAEADARVAPEKGIMAFHRMLLITGLALNKALRDQVQDQDERVGLIQDILWKGPMGRIIRLLVFFIRRTRDPFSRYLQVLGPNNEWYFPCPPWEKESVEVDNGVGWHQHRCPYKDFFDAEGAAELTRAYGDMDMRIAALLPDHIELKREKALCYGDGYCDFLYYRK